MKKNNLPEKSLFPIMETHCHLDYLDDQSITDVIETSRDVGVDKLLTISVSPDNQDKVLSIAKRFDNVFCTQGIHPHEAKFYDQITEDIIIKNSKDPKVRAIGEIGLDYHYDHSPRDIQLSVFEKQLQLSINLKLPVIIHTREAEDDTKSILKNFSKNLTFGLEIHCYSSNLDLANYALSENYYLGFNGILTFKQAQNVRDVLMITPLNQILLETDAPYLSPIPVRGKPNAPFYLPYIARYMCTLLNQKEETLLPIIYENSINFFSKEPHNIKTQS
jgi:TatD DNase family protein